MEYNTKIYCLINYTDVVNLNLIDYRKSIDGSKCIINFENESEIPTNINNVVLDKMTHQETLLFTESNEWTLVL